MGKTDTQEAAFAEIATTDLLGSMPCDSGYYWVKFEEMKYCDLGYLFADDMDAGTRRFRFITGMEMWEGNPRFKNARWFKIHQPSFA